MSGGTAPWSQFIKSDDQSCNYRGIKLTSQRMEIWERVVKARLREEVDICEQQYGLMPEKSTTCDCSTNDSPVLDLLLWLVSSSSPPEQRSSLSPAFLSFVFFLAHIIKSGVSPFSLSCYYSIQSEMAAKRQIKCLTQTNLVCFSTFEGPCSIILEIHMNSERWRETA